MRAVEAVPPAVRRLSSSACRWIGLLAAILAAAVALVAPAGLPIPVLLPSAAAQQCPDVEVVFARGTGEPPGMGRVGQAFVSALQSHLGARTLGNYAVNYPADYDFPAAAQGAADATAHIATMAQQCPATRIVLGGYSQGAAVMDMLGGTPPLGKKIGGVGSAPPLPASLADKVAAVAAFGNPSTKFGNPASTSPLFGGNAIDLCSDGDPICSDGRNPFAHKRYDSPAYANQAADFVAGLV